MTRTLQDLSDDERKALLNVVWSRLVDSEIASPVGTDVPLDSPIGAADELPADLADHLRGAIGTGALSDWKILNGSCAAPK